MYEEYDELVRLLKDKAERFDYDGWVDTAVVMEKAADAIEELSRVADAIPHVCECCIGCEVESGGCDRGFVLSPKRAREYLNRLRWIPATKAPALKVGDEGYPGYLVYANGYYDVADYAVDWLGNGPSFRVDGEYEPDITHYMPLPEPPKENGKSET